jgi:integrase
VPRSPGRPWPATSARNAEAAEARRGTGQAPAVTVKQLRAIVAACPDTVAGRRDAALILIAFGIAARRSEAASLLVSDIVESTEGLTVTVRFGKTGAREVAIPRGTSAATCPVRAWQAWLAASEVVDGPAFRRVDRHGRILGALSAQAAGDIVTRAGERAGIDAHLTGHSLRAGLVTESRRAGHDAKTISATTGHSPNSRVLYGYMRTVDKWDDNALAGIGL